jgi:ABC-2 type transport system permease protein
MRAVAAPTQGRLAVIAGELVKLPAFVRRDFLVGWSYRMAFFTDWISLLLGVVMFYFIGRMVNESALPSYGGTRTTYLEFVIVGVALGAFISLGLGRVSAAIRGEQLAGTLESILTTPTAPQTVQLGSVVYDLIYIPVRTALFVLVVALAFGLDFQIGGALPATVALLVFLPFVWGLGIASAAAILTFRKGSGGVGFGVGILTLASGAFFPLTLMPDWIRRIAEVNPMALTIESMRQALIGGARWADVAPSLLAIAPMSAVALAAGMYAFRRALRREQRLGTLGLY